MNLFQTRKIRRSLTDYRLTLFLSEVSPGLARKTKAPGKLLQVPALSGAGERNRTPDPLITNGRNMLHFPVLYHGLSLSV